MQGHNTDWVIVNSSDETGPLKEEVADHSVFLLRKPHEQYENAKSNDTGR